LLTFSKTIHKRRHVLASRHKKIWLVKFNDADSFATIKNYTLLFNMVVYVFYLALITV